MGIASGLANNTPVIIISDSCGGLGNGCWGYFQNNNPQTTFCDYENNYCGSGNSAGIGPFGESYLNDQVGNGSSGGTSCDVGECSSGTSTGVVPNSSGGMIGSTGSPGSTGSTGTTTSSSAAIFVGSNGSSGTTSGTSGSTDFSADTKDVDLQRAVLQSQQLEDRAQGLVSQFSMNIEAARQLTQIADKMSMLTNQQGGMTDADRASLTDEALAVAGISNDQVTQAYAAYFKGDHSAVDNLIGQAATNLGMPSAVGLREQILPSLGINLGQ